LSPVEHVMPLLLSAASTSPFIRPLISGVTMQEWLNTAVLVDRDRALYGRGRGASS
jgi:hypothetical protein